MASNLQFIDPKLHLLYDFSKDNNYFRCFEIKDNENMKLKLTLFLKKADFKDSYNTYALSALLNNKPLYASTMFIVYAVWRKIFMNESTVNKLREFIDNFSKIMEIEQK